MGSTVQSLNFIFMNELIKRVLVHVVESIGLHINACMCHRMKRKCMLVGQCSDVIMYNVVHNVVIQIKPTPTCIMHISIVQSLTLRIYIARLSETGT